MMFIIRLNCIIKIKRYNIFEGNNILSSICIYEILPIFCILSFMKYNGIVYYYVISDIV